MGKITHIRVDEKLQEVLSGVQKDLAEEIKEVYGIDQITIYGTAASQALAAAHNGEKKIKFKIHKTSPKQGYIEILN
jgi:hypothetical protein|tara:strand:+ start:56 stop:286 length:231 start_codon:yes stop_codon:yes gene_type:complete